VQRATTHPNLTGIISYLLAPQTTFEDKVLKRVELAVARPALALHKRRLPNRFAFTSRALRSRRDRQGRSTQTTTPVDATRATSAGALSKRQQERTTISDCRSNTINRIEHQRQAGILHISFDRLLPWITRKVSFSTLALHPLEARAALQRMASSPFL
jgi:hypothetical protein